MSKRRGPRALKAGIDALRAEVETWMPKAKGWPAVGTRVRLLPPHPWGNHSGVVIRHQTIKIFPEDGELPVVRLDDADDVPFGQCAFIMQMEQWRPAS